ncbi:MAG TPA: hypothetical protein VE954_08405 [Oligoflexus sp.]|uniref:hypothetical protein n=1 Tax=Oligoflexus sp. TaxID=1971216 RepID=UPI002D6AEDE9|nr:hypothetical protein [Oligoflexus sp.]HYX33125.1 hypothetical protein [Oligoflexus sp.]
MRSRIGLFILLLGFSSARAQAACDASTFGQFLAEAQSLGPQAESLGRQMLACPRDDYRHAAVYWLSFVYAMQQNAAAIKDLGRSIPASGSGSEKVQVLYRAWQGDYSGLANRVRIGQRDYADDPFVMLVLARNLIRFEQYKDGLATYQQLISLQDNNESSEIERLYALIWSRDDEAALLRIAAMKRYDLSPYLRQSVERAETLLEKYGNAKPGSDHPAHNVWMRVAGKDLVDLRGYRRRTLEVDYHGPLHVAVGAHELSHPLDPEPQKEASLELGYTFNLTTNWNLQTELGYFSAGDQNLMGRVDNFIRLGESSLGFGLRREAVSLVERPLMIEEQGLMRDTAKVGMSLWKRYVFTAALERDGHEAPFVTYQSELRLGQLVTEETEHGIGFFIPLEFSDHPKPAADAVTYPREWKAGIGLRAAHGDGQYWHLSGDARLLTVSRSYYQDPESFTKLLGAALRLEAKYFVQRSWHVFVEAEREFVEKNPFDEEDEQESLVVLGVALTGAGHGSAAKEMGR